MRKLRWLVAWILLLACSASTWADEDGPVVDTWYGRLAHKDVRTWYKDRHSGQPYVKALQWLSEADEPTRRHASEYLLAFFRQTVYDQQHGLTPDRGGWSLGPGPQDLGAELRWLAARDFAKARLFQDGRDALGPALWLFREDPMRSDAVYGMRVLARIPAPETDAVLREVVSKRHPSFEILRLGLEQVGARKLTGLEDDVRALCNHYHPQVREAARAAAKALGIPDVPAYDRENAFTPGLRKAMADLAAMVFTPIPKDAPWVAAKETAPPWREGAEPTVTEYHGWLLERSESRIALLNWEGARVELDPKRTELSQETLAEVAARIVDLRTRYVAQKNDELGKALCKLLGIWRRSYTVGDWRPTLPEGLLAAWSLVRGDPKTAADVLFPLLVDTGHERALVEYLRDELAARYDATTIHAFVEGDYARALTRARHLSGALFDGTPVQPRAKELAEQLPRRMGEDFQTLKLPTPAEWKAVSAKLDRKEKIRYLAARIRLIRAEQTGNPGGVSFGAPQRGRTEDPADYWSKGQQQINPYVELYSMDLASNELPLLFPVLRSSDFIRAYDMRRFGYFRPWHLYRARWVAGSLIETVAQKDLLDRKILEGGTPEEIDAHLEEVGTWCEAQGPVTYGDRLERYVAEGRDWEKVTSAIYTLHHFDQDRLRRGVARRVVSDTEHRGDLLMVAGHLGIRDALPVARSVLAQSHDDKAKGWAALVVVRFGDRAHREGIDALLDALAASKGPALLNSAVDALLATGDESARAFLVGALKPGGRAEPSLLLVQRLFARGAPEARDLLLALLDGKGARKVFDTLPWMSGSYEQIQDAAEVTRRIVEWTDDLQLPEPDGGKGAWEALQAKTRTWVTKTCEQIQAGQAPHIKMIEPAEPYVAWSGSGQWVRRL